MAKKNWDALVNTKRSKEQQEKLGVSGNNLNTLPHTVFLSFSRSLLFFWLSLSNLCVHVLHIHIYIYSALCIHSNLEKDTANVAAAAGITCVIHATFYIYIILLAWLSCISSIWTLFNFAASAYNCCISHCFSHRNRQFLDDAHAL